MEINDGLPAVGFKELIEIKKNMMEAINSVQRLRIDAELDNDFDRVDMLENTAKCCFRVLGSIKNQEELEMLDRYEAHPIDIKGYLYTFTMACNLRLRLTNIKVYVECEDGIYIWADGERLAVCLANLVINAVQNNYIAERNLEIWIRVRKFSDCASIAVCDDGFGMDSEELRRILESDSNNGGLSVVKKFCKKANAQIITDTRIDGGFMFSFRLPLADISDFKSAKQVPEENRGREGQRPESIEVSYGDFSAVNVLMSKVRNSNLIF